MNYKLNKSEIVFRGKVFDVQVDEIEYMSGNLGRREVAVHPGGAVAVPLLRNNNIIMITQFRYPLQKMSLEFPAGKLDKGEDPFSCAVRELEEETGYKSNNVVKLGSIYTTPGFCTEELHIYLARDLINGEHNREEGELEMEVIEFSFDEAERKILNGEIKDSKTICGIFLAKRFLNKS
jgi:ADP-ribose pyrophosphatase